MTNLRSALERYLSMRKGLGYKYEHQTRRLADFVTFMEKREARVITTKLALEWATLPPDRHASWALRLSDVRGFARHVANFDPRTEAPPVGMLPGWKRAKPYVYSDAEIDALLAAALALPPADGLRRWTYHTLFGLIAVSGMRISEAMGLERVDGPADQIRQVAPRASASDDLYRAARLCRAARRTSGITPQFDFLRCRAGRPPAPPVRLSRLLATVPRDRAAAPR